MQKNMSKKQVNAEFATIIFGLFIFVENVEQSDYVSMLKSKQFLEKYSENW